MSDTTLEPFKFLVQTVLLQRDQDGKITGEVTAETTALYGVEALADFAARFEDELAKLNDAAPDETTRERE